MSRITSMLTGLLFLVQTGWAQDEIEVIQSAIFKAKDRVMPALVHVEPIQEIFSQGVKQKRQITGSGVIFHPDGFVITNNHVAEKASKMTCVLYNKQKVEAEVIGVDPFTDIAVLKLDVSQVKDEIRWAVFGDSEKLQPGEIVFALGSPLGLARSISMGVISCIDRYFESQGDMVSPYNLWLQTDAAINPGNSGGPLVNLKGEVIGINARGVMFGENLGFAIPGNIVSDVVERILKDGRVRRSWIGLEFQSMESILPFLDEGSKDGVLVSSVSEGSPAELAGVEVGDIVIEYDGMPVSAQFTEELPKIRKKIADTPIGREVVVKVSRKGTRLEFKLVTTEKEKFEGEDLEIREWGITVKEMTEREAKIAKLDTKKGIRVSGVKTGSAAYDAGVNEWEIIRTIDGVPVGSLEEMKMLLQKHREGKKELVMLYVQRGNMSSYHFSLLQPIYASSLLEEPVDED